MLVRMWRPLAPQPVSKTTASPLEAVDQGTWPHHAANVVRLADGLNKTVHHFFKRQRQPNHPIRGLDIPKVEPLYWYGSF
jgi:hypothetical protein